MRETVPPAAVEGRAMIALALVGQRSAADEVHLAADAAVHALADRVGTHLAGQVDLDRRVDRDHALEAADDRRVVGVLGRTHLDHRVVVGPAIEPLESRA